MNSILNKDVLGGTVEENHGSSTNQIEEKQRSGLNLDLCSARHPHESFLDVLLWLKDIAIDNFMTDTSSSIFKESRRVIFYSRKFLSLSLDDASWRKRKLNQFLQEAVKTPDPPVKKPNEINSRKRGKYSITPPPSDSEGSSDQILRGPQKFVDNLSQKRIPNCHSFLPDEDVLPLLDSDDSVSGSYLSCSKLRYSPYKKASSIYKAVSSPREGSLLLDKKPAEFFDFFGDDYRMAIPVGPRFQAEIPPKNSNSDNKWLGTRIWPRIEEGKNINGMDKIGKGRLLSCCCASRGSTECIKLHVSERRHELKIELSSVFYSWRFDQMGEDVSRGWTIHEQEKFRSIVKSNPLSEEKSFWKPAIRNFPGKSRESLVSYYFNVYVLGRMSRQTRLRDEVDSDDDETDDGIMASLTKDTKQRYLTGIR